MEFLDAGRGIAILGVIAVHTVQHFSTGLQSLDVAIGVGQFGVQLFYIISAYTMQYTLSSRVGREQSPFLNFWIRRYCRIAIPFWAGMGVYEGFRAAGVGFFASTGNDLLSLITSTFLLQGFWPTSLSSVVPGGGTIAAEAIFYMVFPLIFLMRGSVPKIAFIGSSMIIVDHIAIRPLYSKLFSLFATNLSINDTASFFYYYIFNQFPTFLFGLYLYGLTTTGFRRAHIAALLPFLSVYFFFTPKLAAISLLAAALLFWMHRSKSIPYWLLWIGRYSYSLYLFHFMVLNGLLILWAHYPPHPGLVTFFMNYLLAIAGAILVSFITRPVLEDLGSEIGRRLVSVTERRAKPRAINNAHQSPVS